MVLFDLLLVLTAISGLLAAGFWVRVAMSKSLEMAAKLDGTEKLAQRGNRRAATAALIASGLTALLAVAAYIAGRGAGMF
jgi:hypothetical protein